MPYKTTAITRKSSAAIPDFDEWLDQQDSSILADYPECVGKTPAQVLQESMEVYSDPAKGFISSSSRVSDDGLSWTWETIWESREAYQSSENVAAGNTGETDQNLKVSPALHIKQLYKNAFPNGFTHTWTETNI